MQIKNMIESAQILTDAGLGHHFLNSDHDIIYGPGVHHIDEKVSKKDQERLETLGWHRDDESECIAHFT